MVAQQKMTRRSKKGEFSWQIELEAFGFHSAIHSVPEGSPQVAHLLHNSLLQDWNGAQSGSAQSFPCDLFLGVGWGNTQMQRQEDEDEDDDEYASEKVSHLQLCWLAGWSSM